MTEPFMSAISQFHFLRPLWLLMLIPCGLILAILWQQHQQRGSWQKVIAPELLQHLLHEKEQRISRAPLMLLMAGWLLACIAIAGPTWEKQPTPVSKSQQPLVIAVDLSYYMLTADIKPDRMTRARYKLQDLIRLRKDGVTALISYAGSAHTVAPLTDDTRTLINLVKALNPAIMPVQGNKPAEAVKLAKELLQQGSTEAGELILVTGTLSASQSGQINDLLEGTNIRLSVLGVGTEEGAPIPLPDGGYLKDRQGSIVVPQLAKDKLTQLAKTHDGQYRDMTVNDSDLKTLLPKTAINDNVILVDREFDQWHDSGYWLILLLLPLALTGFRRGWLVAVMVAVTLPVTPEALAFEWQDLWQTQNQQAQKALQNGDTAKAAETFTDNQWKAQAQFQNQQYEQAAQSFANGETARDAYNQGNALARANKLPEAMKAYDRALSIEPDMKDARFNRDTVEKLMEQQKQQDQNQKDQNKDQQQQDDNSDQKDSDQKDSEQQNSEQKDSEQKQSEDQQNGQQKDSEEQKQPEQQTSEQQSEQQKKEQEEKQQQQAQQSKPEQEQSEDSEQQQAQVEQDDSPSTPEKQAVESWLRTIPDDPGGLLRRKFQQQQQQRQQQSERGQAW